MKRLFAFLIVIVVVVVISQINLLAENYSLHFNPLKSSDTGKYTCIINDKSSPDSVVDLLVQGKYLN